MIRRLTPQEFFDTAFKPGIALAVRCSCCNHYTVKLFFNDIAKTLQSVPPKQLATLRDAGFQVVIASERDDGSIRIDFNHPLGDIGPRRRRGRKR